MQPELFSARFLPSANLIREFCDRVGYLMLVTGTIVGGVAIVGAGALALAGFGSWNQIIALDQRCQQALSDIDVQLRFRADLIPNLVEVVRGYGVYESHMIEALIEARNDAIKAATFKQTIKADTAITVQIGDIIKNFERLPEARGDQYFQDLRAELKDIEHKLAAARRYYNLTVSELNAKRQQIPGVFVAKWAGKTERTFYDLGIERGRIEEAPSVRLVA